MARILIIEDEMSIRMLAADVLRLGGHEVAEAPNGIEGLAMAAQWPIDLVITDIIMPMKDGIETIMVLRRAYPNLPVIAISGGGRFSSYDHLNLAQKLGARAVLTKPFDGRSLLNTVANVLGQPVFQG